MNNVERSERVMIKQTDITWVGQLTATAQKLKTGDKNRNELIGSEYENYNAGDQHQLIS